MFTPTMSSSGSRRPGWQLLADSSNPWFLEQQALACVRSRLGSPCEALRKAGGFPFTCSTFEHVSGQPLLGLTRDGEKGLKVIQTERGPIAPRSGLILPFSLTFCQIVASV